MTLVYVVRPGERNERLRYSLRSVAAHLPHARVVIAGHKPSWVKGVEHVPIHQPLPHRSDMPGMIRRVCEAFVADEWVLMNDDFFALTPSPAVENVYTMELSALAYQTGWRSGWYKRAREYTEQLLLLRGVRLPMSFDRVHQPMHLVNADLLEVFDETGDKDVLVRSLYGNMVSGGVPGKDAKVRGFTGKVPLSGWMSVDRESWQGQGGWAVRNRFGMKCQFEA